MAHRIPSAVAPATGRGEQRTHRRADLNRASRPGFLTGALVAAPGVLVTAALLGSAAMLFVASRWSVTLHPLRVLLLSSALMVATGVAFAVSSSFVVLLVLALVGPRNPTGG